MSQNTSSSLPPGLLVFPYFAGPTVGKFATPLLWEGQLITAAPAWVSPFPIDHAIRVFDRAQTTKHRLDHFFHFVAHHFELAQIQGSAVMESLRPLEGRVSKVLFVGPGTTEAYADWEPFHNPCLSIASHMLEDTQMLNAAAVEFIWRVYEASLEHGEDADAVLSDLDKRATVLGNPVMLMAECALHRHKIGQVSRLSLATDKEGSMAILSVIGAPFVDEHTVIQARVNELGFALFDGLFAKHTPLLIGNGIEKIATLFEKHDEARHRAREKCLEQARELVATGKADDALKNELAERMATLQEEVTSILKIDTESFRELCRSLPEDSGIWSAVLLLVGGFVTGTPLVGAASAAVTALTSLGANALKESRRRRDTIRDSPWSFAYRLRH